MKPEIFDCNPRGPWCVAACRRPVAAVVCLACFTLCCAVRPAGADRKGTPPRKLVREYNHLLDDAVPDGPECCRKARPEEIGALGGLVDQLHCAHISDPQTLQKFHFAESYEGVRSLEYCHRAELAGYTARWKACLVGLDVKAYRINAFYERPSARWVVAKARRLPAAPTQRMIEGYIEREETTVFIAEDGDECPGKQKGCEKLRYVLIRFLVPGKDNPAKVREILQSFPPEKANPRVTDYLEVTLEKNPLLLRRDYHLKPLPGYEGTMENYHELVFQDRQRTVLLEVNTRVGAFILRSDNAAAYIMSPPHGVTVAFLFSGKYAMEGFFRTLAGDKPLEESLKSLTILRQYCIDPGAGVEHAVRAGLADYETNQKP